MRPTTRRRWRRLGTPVGAGSVKPWAAKAIRRAWASDSESGAVIAEKGIETL